MYINRSTNTNNIIVQLKSPGNYSGNKVSVQYYLTGRIPNNTNKSFN